MKTPEDIAQLSALWMEDFKVHSYEVDFKQVARLESLCRLFQEAAWNHAEELGVGYQRLQRENRIWVLSRLLVKVERYPRWGETIALHTWPRAAKSVFAMRDFEMFDAGGVKLVAGASAWLVLDAGSRKPQRVDRIVSGIRASADRRALEQEPGRLAACESAAVASELTARYSDVDVNGHVNNSCYIGWILDSYRMEFHRTHAVRLLEVNYLGETGAGDMISVLSKEVAPGEYWHAIVKTDGGEVCRGRIIWNGGSME